MAPEHDSARTPALYDHASDGPSTRGRRSAADWGVNEDIFDCMPSRRFARQERRAEHAGHGAGEPRAPRFDRRVSGPADGRRDGADQEGPRRVELWDAENERAAAWAEPDRAPKREVESWIVDEPPSEDERRVESWLEPEQRPVSGTIVIETGGADDPAGGEWADSAADLDDVRGEQGRTAPRTIILETGETDALVLRPEDAARPADRDAVAVNGRRTVRISGHPDRLPAPRAQRPPKTAIDRIGTSPDRIVAYAVALGFLLVVIAVLTTGQ